MSTIKVDTIKNTSNVEVYTCKAWVNFNGIGTVAIRASGNVTSITDNGTGNYTINFTNALTDTNYALASMQGHTVGDGAARAVVYDQDNTKTTTALQIRTVYDWVNYYDAGEIYAAVFR